MRTWISLFHAHAALRLRLFSHLPRASCLLCPHHHLCSIRSPFCTYNIANERRWSFNFPRSFPLTPKAKMTGPFVSRNWLQTWRDTHHQLSIRVQILLSAICQINLPLLNIHFFAFSKLCWIRWANFSLNILF